MARTDTEVRETFLVEHYRPGLSADELGAWATRVRDTAGEMESEGKAVRYVRCTVVPTDECLLCTFEAASEELVRDAYARAGIPFERITAVIPDIDALEREEGPVRDIGAAVVADDPSPFNKDRKESRCSP